jgi:hypothetical protein
MASVYRAENTLDGQTVALKILAPQLAMEPKFKARFEREARVLRDLEHPNIVPILDFGEVDGLTFIVMPYMQVGGLSDRLKEGPLAVDEGARIFEQISSALQFAHERGIVHRDVKPSNVLIDEDGNAWLSDFGFAYVHDATLSLTGSALIGTPAYMAPEQVRGEAVTPRSDLYSLGVVLYQMSTGYLPYDAETPMGIAFKQATEPLPRPRTVNPNLPDAVERVIIRALAKKPAQRYESVEALNRAFHAALEEAYDPATGKLRPGAIGQDPVTEVLEPIEELEEQTRRRPLAWARNPIWMVLLIAFPAVFLGVSVFGGNGAPVGVQRTIDALYTQNAPAAGTVIAPGGIETAVAGTLAALSPGDGEPDLRATRNPADVRTVGTPANGSITPGATETPSGGYFPGATSTSAGGSDGGGQPSATSTPLPSRTPSRTPTPPPTATVPPTATIPPTETLVPTVPPTPTPIDKCLPNAPPGNKFYCTPTPEP